VARIYLPSSTPEPEEAPTEATVETPDGPPEPPAAPAKSASKPEWVDYAVALGAVREDAEKATKDELIELYGA
jgi:hypothetical protein